MSHDGLFSMDVHEHAVHVLEAAFLLVENEKMSLVQNIQSAFRLAENEKMSLVQNIQSAFRLAENEKMSLVQNVQSAFQLVENQNNTCPLLDRQCMRKCKIVYFLIAEKWEFGQMGFTKTLNLIFCYQKSRKLENCILRKRLFCFSTVKWQKIELSTFGPS